LFSCVNSNPFPLGLICARHGFGFAAGARLTFRTDVPNVIPPFTFSVKLGRGNFFSLILFPFRLPPFSAFLVPTPIFFFRWILPFLRSIFRTPFATVFPFFLFLLLSCPVRRSVFLRFSLALCFFQSLERFFPFSFAQSTPLDPPSSWGTLSMLKDSWSPLCPFFLSCTFLGKTFSCFF